MLDKLTSWWSPAPAPAPAPAAAPACHMPSNDKAYNPSDPTQNPLNPKGLKPCCACPETKRARDDCFMSFDAAEADEKCKALVQSHVQCMRNLGFTI